MRSVLGLGTKEQSKNIKPGNIGKKGYKYFIECALSDY